MKISRKTQAGAMALVLALSLGLTGSLAWQDISQHKTNNFNTAQLEYHVVLVEDFKPEKDWKVNEVVNKSVSVRNGEDSNDNSLEYQDAYIRIKFEQFMAVGELTYIDSEYRYMVDGNTGNFVRFETEEEAQDYIDDPTNILQDDVTYTIDQVETYFDQVCKTEEPTEVCDHDLPEGGYFYIQTQANDPNGQYGKFLVVDAIQETLTDIITNDEVDMEAFNDYDTGYEDHDRYYIPKLWYEDDQTIGENDALFNKYVEWTLGANVITLETWIDVHKGNPVAMWILDTGSSEGWVYWGQALTHSNTIDVPSTMTYDFLDSVELIEDPGGAANYQIHVSMDAVSLDDLGLWSDAPNSIILALNGDIVELEGMVNSLEDLIDDALLVDSTNKFIDPDAIDTFETSLTSAQSALDAYNSVDSSVTKPKLADLQNCYDALQTAMIAITPALDLNDADVGDTIAFAGIDWTIIQLDGLGNALLLSNISASDTAMKYTDSGTYGNGYVDSLVKNSSDAIYTSVSTEDTDNESLIQKVHWYDEIGSGNSHNWSARNDGPTKINNIDGTKQGFALSVSDIIYHRIDLDVLAASDSYWLRSPGLADDTAAYIDIVDGSVKISSATVDSEHYVRTAIWIKTR